MRETHAMNIICKKSFKFKQTLTIPYDVHTIGQVKISFKKIKDYSCISIFVDFWAFAIAEWVCQTVSYLFDGL